MFKESQLLLWALYPILSPLPIGNCCCFDFFDFRLILFSLYIYYTFSSSFFFNLTIMHLPSFFIVVQYPTGWLYHHLFVMINLLGFFQTFYIINCAAMNSSNVKPRSQLLVWCSFHNIGMVIKTRHILIYISSLFSFI